jgi:putative SOS response-associated peptidase YedK
MCSNYDAVTDADRMLQYFGVSYSSRGEMEGAAVRRALTFPTGFAPFIRLHESGSGNKVLDEGTFGLLPGFAKEVSYGRRTYNARSETVHKLPSFREAWAKGWRCIVPVETIYEYSYQSGKAERVAIRRADGKPFAIGGIYRHWTSPDGELIWSFAMVTINADGHPVYARMNKPEDEKRMTIMLESDEQDDWLTCSVADAPKFFKQWRGELTVTPASLKRPRGPQQAF